MSTPSLPSLFGIGGRWGPQTTPRGAQPNSRSRWEPPMVTCRRSNNSQGLLADSSQGTLANSSQGSLANSSQGSLVNNSQGSESSSHQSKMGALQN